MKVIRLKVIKPPGGIRTHNCPIPIYFFVLHFSIFFVDCPTKLSYNLGSECPTKTSKSPTFVLQCPTIVDTMYTNLIIKGYYICVM